MTAFSAEETPIFAISKENRPKTNVANETVRKSAPAHSGKIMRPEFVAAGIAADLASAASVSTAQIAPAAAATNPVVSSTGFTTLPVQAAFRDTIANSTHFDFEIASLSSTSTSFDSGSIERYSQSTESSTQVALATPLVAWQATEAPESATNQPEQSPILNPGDSTVPVRIAIESTNLHGNSQSPIPLRSEIGNLLNPSTLSQIPPPGQTQLNQSQSQTAAQDALPQPTSSQMAVRRSAPNPNPGQTIATAGNSNQATTTGQIAVEIPSSSQTPPRSFAPGFNQVSVLHQSREEVVLQPATQGLNAVSASISRAESNSSPEFASPVAIPPAQYSPALPQSTGKQAVTGNGKNSAISLTRSVRAAGNNESVQQGTLLEKGQPLPLAVDATTTARVVGNPGSVSTSASTPVSTEPDSRETFATLDSGAAGKPAWLHADARRAEAGFQDPTLGWVSVRADINGGGVHAELVPGSTEAAQTLGGQLAELNAYLAEHHKAVETVTVTSPESGGQGLGSGQGAGAETQHGTGQQSGQQTRQDSSANYPVNVTSIRSDSSLAEPEPPAAFAGLERGAQRSWAGGNHISVMA